MKPDDYSLDMEINPGELDIEWINQPALMMKYTKKAAELREKRDLLKEELELLKAQLDKEVRSDPEEYGLTKTTETIIQNTVISIDEYQDLLKTYLRASYEVNVAQGVVQAIEQRKQALENLVRLHGQQYFAGPSVPRNLQEEIALKQKESNKGISQKLKRTKHE